ncbi:hypothetical protein [Ruegeria atlantica]|uniref:hypothetical protein n=1 Tax=Ruegeria atlantica TaxID=81569 RepID=UPI002493F513|nr:hypothetical protein [Ruegeria atlantica]
MDDEFDISKRAAQKAAQRAADEARLKNGEISAEELQAENSHGMSKLFRNAPWEEKMPDGSIRRIKP